MALLGQSNIFDRQWKFRHLIIQRNKVGKKRDQRDKCDKCRKGKFYSAIAGDKGLCELLVVVEQELN